MMTHYRLFESKPSAIITVNGSEKKIYDNGIVFLNNGENFEIRFFNPLQRKVGVEIIFNGLKKTDNLLVINPGEDLILDRFLDEKKKMKFETYFIDGNNPDAVKATSLNGLIEIKFYLEKVIPIVIYDYNITTYTSPNFYTTCNNQNIKYFTNTYTSNFYSINNLETGRIEKGEESKQTFMQVDVEFENHPFHIITYHLKPVSQKPNDFEIRNYCSSCGYRIRKKSWSYCPKCGEKL